MPETPNSRLTAEQIYTRVESDAAEELERCTRQLVFSGLGAGLVMGLSGVGVAIARASLGAGPDALVPWLLYPLGFIVVIVGRQQLFTENTLSPVTLVLRRRSRLLATLRLWAVVALSNLVGALAVATLIATTTATSAEVDQQVAALGVETVDQSGTAIFFTAVVGGWIIALMTWMVTAANTTSAQLFIIVVMTFVVGAGHFTHSIAGAAEAFVAAMVGDVPVGLLLGWLGLALVGNTVGGVVMVALFNYGQVASDGDEREDDRSLGERVRPHRERAA